MTDVLAALALMVTLEGVAIVVFADRFGALARQLAELPHDRVRVCGIAGVVFGALSYILVRAFV